MARRPRQRRRVPPRAVDRRRLLAVVVAIAVMAVLGRLTGWRASVDTAAACDRATLTGEVTLVRDGGTIEVAGVPIRLDGLAAPGWDEPGGPEATAAMRELVTGRALSCDLTGERTYARCVGVCYLGDVDIAAAMVRRGLARDCPRFSGGRYRQEELAAAAAGATIREAYPLPGYCRPR